MSAAATTRSEDVEPKFEWVQREGCETLLVHLPGYKRENLKVQVTTSRNLRVLGERKINERKSGRFQKEFSLKEDCDVNKITAKFEGEVLQVKLPKMAEAAAPAMQKEEAKQETKHKHAADAKTEDEIKKGIKDDEKMEPVEDAKGRDKFASEGKNRKVRRGQVMRNKTALLATIVLAVAVAVAIGVGMLRKMRDD
ncbi:unnamed protein product [Rhodiola kirilowii]